MPKISWANSASLRIIGCATLVSGRTQEINFISNPDGATVTVGGSVIGKTPLTVQLERKPKQSLIFEKAGYKPLSLLMETKLNGWFWGNLVFGGIIIGGAIDSMSGALHEYVPSQYIVSLERLADSAIDDPTRFSQQQLASSALDNLAKDEIKKLVALFSSKRFHELQVYLDQVTSTKKSIIVDDLKMRQSLRQLTAVESSLLEWIKEYRRDMWR